MLYDFFWVIPGVWILYADVSEHSVPSSQAGRCVWKFPHTPTCLWRWNRQSVPKRRHIKFRRRGITQKKSYNIQNTAKVWNQELFTYLWHGFKMAISPHYALISCKEDINIRLPELLCLLNFPCPKYIHMIRNVIIRIYFLINSKNIASPLQRQAFMVTPCINNIKHFIVQLMHTMWNVELLKHIKIVEDAPTCFGLQGNHHQGATAST